ncbi:MAG TPA: GNAT family N-acetyltransferase [Candidatus Limnocylindrales bacterium]|nr:GNAT family N-acetyltransferase [Candidatus Limnocylindrales bacterium]
MTSPGASRVLEPADRAPVVREARPEEWAAAGAIVQAAYRGDDDPATLDAPSRAYLDHVADVADRARTCTILVALLDGELAGCLTLVPGPGGPYSETERPGEAGIRMLGVDPRRQGRGVGRALMLAAIERARAAGARRLTLVVRADNPPAHALYRRLGFRRAPDRDFTPTPGVELQGYELDL